MERLISNRAGQGSAAHARVGVRLRCKISLVEVGAGGPVIVGRADNADVLRLEGFLGRNGHPPPAAELCALS
jgi:hypothetical protein